MARAATQNRPVMVGDLQNAWRFLRYTLVPIIGVLLGAIVWAHDTNAAVKKLESRQPTIDTVLHRLDKRTEILNYKVDLLLEERSRSAVAPR